MMSVWLTLLVIFSVTDNISAAVWGGYCEFNNQKDTKHQTCYSGSVCPAGTTPHTWYNSPFMCPSGKVCCVDGGVTPPPQCGTVAALSARIGYGQTIPQCLIPWQVSIRGRLDQSKPLTMDNTRHLCGATLIGPQHVVTSAVCLFWAGTGSNPNDFTVEDDILIVAGDWDHMNTDYYNNVLAEQVFTIKRWHLHPGFDQNVKNFYQINQQYLQYNSRSYQANGVVVIQLNKAVDYTDCVTPICLPTSSSSSTCADGGCVMTGWGNTETNDIKDKLQIAPVWIPTVNTCGYIEYYTSNIETLPANTTCALSYQRPAAFNCVGDNGGPVSCLESTGKWVLKGVILLRIQCSSGAPVPIADVTKMADWIRNTMNSDI